MDDDCIKWSPRVPQQKLRRLYESTCHDPWNEDLIEDVGITLYLRCRDILSIHKALTEQKITCPRCQRLQTTTQLLVPADIHASMTCPVCQWSLTWYRYHATFQGRQLNPGGAVKYFQEFMHRFERGKNPKDKMLAIDRVIHEFHYLIKELPDQPARAAAVNLIEGKLKEAIRFLDDLSGMNLPDPFQKNYSTWREKQNSIRWDEVLERKRQIQRDLKQMDKHRA